LPSLKAYDNILLTNALLILVDQHPNFYHSFWHIRKGMEKGMDVLGGRRGYFSSKPSLHSYNFILDEDFQGLIFQYFWNIKPVPPFFFFHTSICTIISRSFGHFQHVLRILSNSSRPLIKVKYRVVPKSIRFEFFALSLTHRAVRTLV